MATRTWTGAVSNLWETAGNWDTGVPVTGDDVIIPTGMGIINGTPSGDALGIITVNGGSVLNVVITANGVFNDQSGLGAAGQIDGSEFNDDSACYGTISGDVVCNDNSYIAETAIVTGNASFTAIAQSTAITGRFNPQQGTVSGTIDFPNGCEFTLEDGEGWTADTTGWTASGGVLTWLFNGASSNSGILSGSALFGASVVPFMDDLPATVGTVNENCELAFSATVMGGANTNPFSGISGTVTISGDLVVEYSGTGESFTGDTSAFVVTGSLGFVFSGDNSYNAGTIVGNVNFSGLTAHNAFNITGYVTFSGIDSGNAQGYIIGTCDMVHPTSYHQESTVDGTVIFRTLESVRSSLVSSSPQADTFDTSLYTPTLVFPFADVLGTGML